jgi:hypothetical protein
MPPKRNKGKGREDSPTTIKTESTNSKETDLDISGYLPGTDLDKDLQRGMEEEEEEEEDDIMGVDAEVLEEGVDDDDKDSLDEWIQDDEEEIDDNEIT